MVSVDYTDVHNAMNLTVGDITAAKTEDLMDFAIDMLNLYAGTSLSNMTGSAGSKTATLTQKERAAVLIFCRALYLGVYKDIDAVGAGGVTLMPVNVFDTPQAMRTLEKCARMLRTYSFNRT